MYSLFKKEIKQFLGSLTGYLVIVTFLTVSGLFLWIFPGNFNIIENNYATLEPFFELAPWLYLFLIPAITMRQFAEEKKAGTLELLLTRPLGDMQLVGAKFLASLMLVTFTLMPSLIYFYSVYQLGNPVGNIDTGGTWGAYVGLLLLASVYISMGLFASAISDNQIIAFIFSLLFSFIFYLGFEFIAGTGIPYFLEKTVTWLSINDHFLSLSRGVIDGRDILYFIGMVLFFLLLTMLFLRKGRTDFRNIRNGGLGLALGFMIIWVVSENLRLKLDLTGDRRYTLSKVTKDFVRKLDEPVTVELFLTGELPPGFRRLQQAVVDKIKDIGRISRNQIRIIISDPYKAVPAADRERFFKALAEIGVQPTDLRQKTSKGMVTTLIFPGAVVSKGKKHTGINFLRNNPGFNHEVNLHNSVQGIEFELVTSFQRLMVSQKPELVFLQGHGELNRWEVGDLKNSLSGEFRIDFSEAMELYRRDTIPQVVVIANPRIPFEETDKFILDQLLMKGSRLVWLVDPVEVSLDSLSEGYMTLALPRDLHLNDQLFHYGCRINTDLLQDVVCAQILVNTALAGSNPRFTPQPWYYSPLLTPSDHHPLSKNLNQVYAEFVSSIDTVNSSGEIRSSVILSSSPYGRIVRTPAAVSLESINKPPARELFNKPGIPAGILLEGIFTSFYRNRMLNQLKVNPAGLKDVSNPAKMAVFSDGDLIANKVRYKAGSEPEILALGYDRVSNQTFGNKEFFINLFHYLTDDEGIMELRNSDVKLRLLDIVRLREESGFWKWINVGVPVVLIVLFSMIYNILRKRKYSVHKI